MINFSHIFKAIAQVLVIGAGAISTTAWAADTTITMTGKVYSAACTINAELTNGLAVTFNPLGQTRLSQPGNAGEWQNFELNLTDCPSDITTSTVTFSGTEDVNDNTLFANTAAQGASGVGIQLAKSDNHGEILSNNSKMTVAVDNAKNANFLLAARLYTPTGGVRPGKVASSVIVNFTYQ